MVFLKKRKAAEFIELGQLATSLLAPMVKKRAGLNIELISNWAAIVGSDVADQCQPLKIIWPKRASEVDEFKPACLVIACEGFAALKLMHQTSEVISRVNVFFGYKAIDHIKIKQQPVRSLEKVQFSRKPVVTKDMVQKIEEMTEEINDARLRQSLQELGKCVMAKSWERF